MTILISIIVLFTIVNLLIGLKHARMFRDAAHNDRSVNDRFERYWNVIHEQRRTMDGSRIYVSGKVNEVGGYEWVPTTQLLHQTVQPVADRTGKLEDRVNALFEFFRLQFVPQQTVTVPVPQFKEESITIPAHVEEAPLSPFEEVIASALAVEEEMRLHDTSADGGVPVRSMPESPRPRRGTKRQVKK